jgi:hypothetical protein
LPDQHLALGVQAHAHIYLDVNYSGSQMHFFNYTNGTNSIWLNESHPTYLGIDALNHDWLFTILVPDWYANYPVVCKTTMTYANATIQTTDIANYFSIWQYNSSMYECNWWINFGYQSFPISNGTQVNLTFQCYRTTQLWTQVLISTYHLNIQNVNTYVPPNPNIINYNDSFHLIGLGCLVGCAFTGLGTAWYIRESGETLIPLVGGFVLLVALLFVGLYLLGV